MHKTCEKRPRSNNIGSMASPVCISFLQEGWRSLPVSIIAFDLSTPIALYPRRFKALTKQPVPHPTSKNVEFSLSGCVAFTISIASFSDLDSVS